MGDVEGYMIFVSARSGPTRKDGVLVALCLRTFARSEVTAVHETVKGMPTTPSGRALREAFAECRGAAS